MLKPQFPIHHFHAHGHAFGATFTAPHLETIPSQAPVSISSHGGHAYSSVEKFNHRELVRFERASTQIAAIHETDSYDTVITAMVEGLNVFNHFTADAVVAHLSVKTMKADGAMSFRTIGTRFENLRIGGVPFEPVIVDEDGDQYGKGTVNNPVYDLYSGKQVNGSFQAKGHLSTLVSDLGARASRRIEVKGNGVFVPDFGTVYLAEYLVTPNARQLNLFRISLGCGVSGKAGSGVGANGSTVPPPGP